jgi:hypothetical protein
MRGIEEVRALLIVAAALSLAACGSWRGTPKVPAESAYSQCVRQCPSHICAPLDDNAKAWECLADPLKPEAGK